MRLRDYETICIFKPHLSAEMTNRLEQKLRPHIEIDGGAVLSVQPWGRKKLAYPIQKEREGLYVRFHYVAHAAHVQEIEKILSYDETILKYLTVKLNDADVTVEALQREKEPDIPEYFRSEREFTPRDHGVSRGGYQEEGVSTYKEQRDV